MVPGGTDTTINHGSRYATTYGPRSNKNFATSPSGSKSEPGECRSASESLKVVICVLRKQRFLVSLPFQTVEQSYTKPKHLLYADSLLLARRSAGLGVGMDTLTAIACFIKRQRQ